MLKTMEYLGSVGVTRTIEFFSDGDGDFRPIFDWSCTLPQAKLSEQSTQSIKFDAG